MKVNHQDFVEYRRDKYVDCREAMRRIRTPALVFERRLIRSGRDRDLDRAPRILCLHLDEPLEIPSYFSEHCGFFL